MSARLLSTPASCWWAALAFVTATPSLLGHGPARHPVCETSIAVVWLGGCHAATALIRTALAMNSAAPLLLWHGPTCLPVCETIGAIVRIGWPNRLRNWLDDGLDGLWRCGWRAAAVMDSAAPLLLVSGPGVLGINCTVEGIHRSTGVCGRWLSNRRWRRSRRWCGWNGGSGLREGCGAAPSHR